MKPQTKIYAVIGFIILLMSISLSVCVLYNRFQQIKTVKDKVDSPKKDVDYKTESSINDEMIQDHNSTIQTADEPTSPVKSASFTRSVASYDSISNMNSEPEHSNGDESDDDERHEHDIILDNNDNYNSNDDVILESENNIIIDSFIEENSVHDSPLSVVSDQSDGSFIKI